MSSTTAPPRSPRSRASWSRARRARRPTPTGLPTRGSHRAPRPGRGRRRASPWALSCSTAATWGMRPPADRWQPRSRNRSSSRTSSSRARAEGIRRVERETIGERYTVEARIGQGGMAEVFRGFDPSLDRTVAIKVLVHPFDRDAGFVARFRREAQAAARLNHPNIVGVYDAGSDGDTQFIVMEYVEGRTLASFMGSGGKPTTEQAIELTEKVASGVQCAHHAGR